MNKLQGAVMLPAKPAPVFKTYNNKLNLIALRTMSDHLNHWSDRQEFVYNRDDHICQHCGRRGGPDGDATLKLDYIHPLDGDNGSKEPVNCRTLCHQCASSRPVIPDPADTVHAQQVSAGHRADDASTPAQTQVDTSDDTGISLFGIITAGIFYLPFLMLYGIVSVVTNSILGTLFSYSLLILPLLFLWYVR